MNLSFFFDEFRRFEGKKDEFFLYLYLPCFFKMFHFEEII